MTPHGAENAVRISSVSEQTHLHALSLRLRDPLQLAPISAVSGSSHYRRSSLWPPDPRTRGGERRRPTCLPDQGPQPYSRAPAMRHLFDVLLGEQIRQVRSARGARRRRFVASRTLRLDRAVDEPRDHNRSCTGWCSVDQRLELSSPSRPEVRLLHREADYEVVELARSRQGSMSLDVASPICRPARALTNRQRLPRGCRDIMHRDPFACDRLLRRDVRPGRSTPTG